MRFLDDVLLDPPTIVATHTTSEPNALIGWVFLGLVVTGIWLFASTSDTKTTVWTAAGGWVAGLLLLTLF